MENGKECEYGIKGCDGASDYFKKIVLQGLPLTLADKMEIDKLILYCKAVELSKKI